MSQKENREIKQAQELARKYQLPMKFLRFEERGWEDKPTFYFACGQRLDFREIVKDLNKIYNQKIMLMQVSSREATTVIGGLGPCGRIVCCKLWLNAPVEEANHCPNGGEGGYCGKVRCCCLYEDDNFKAPCKSPLSETEMAEKAKVSQEEQKEKTPPTEGKLSGKEKRKKPIKKLVRQLVIKHSKKRRH